MNTALAIPTSITVANQYDSHTSQLPSPVAHLEFMSKDIPRITLGHFTNHHRITIEIALTGNIIQNSSLNDFIKQTLKQQLHQLESTEIQQLINRISPPTSTIDFIDMSLKAFDSAMIDYSGHYPISYLPLELLLGQRGGYINDEGIFRRFDPRPALN